MKPPSTRSAWSSAAGPGGRQLEEGEAGEELVVGDVVEQRPSPAPTASGRSVSVSTAARRPAQRFGGERVEGGDEGLALAGEVVVEGLVGDAGRGRDRRDAERLVALLDAEPGRGADDPLALAQVARLAGCRGARPSRAAAVDAAGRAGSAATRSGLPGRSPAAARRSAGPSRRSARPVRAARRRARSAGAGRRCCGSRRRSRARSARRPRAASAAWSKPSRMKLSKRLEARSRCGDAGRAEGQRLDDHQVGGRPAPRRRSHQRPPSPASSFSRRSVGLAEGLVDAVARSRRRCRRRSRGSSPACTRSARRRCSSRRRARLTSSRSVVLGVAVAGDRLDHRALEPAALVAGDGLGVHFPRPAREAGEDRCEVGVRLRSPCVPMVRSNERGQLYPGPDGGRGRGSRTPVSASCARPWT